MREVRWLQNGWWGSSQRRLLCALAVVLALGGAFGESLSAQSSTGMSNWSGPLRILRNNSNEIVTLSLMQEQLISDLQSEVASLQRSSSDQRSDNERLATLSEEQRADLRTQGVALTESQSSHDATSQYWTSYLSLSETAIRETTERALRAEKANRRNRLGWQIGVPLALVTGVAIGVLVR